MMTLLRGFLALLLSLPLLHALDNGLARQPPLGFNTWNFFHCNISQQLLRDTMDAVIDLGLAAEGYTYINIDDCWQAGARDAQGQLHPHPDRFPDGIPPLAEYAHERGLKLGIYSDAGFKTCAGFPGSLGYEVQDAKLWASWGVDLLKYDNCYAPDLNVRRRYEVMRNALLATGSPIVYSLCSWGWGQPWLWGASVGHSWRIDGDIEPSTRDILRSLDACTGLSKYAGPGGWNDPDMLEVGNGALPLALQRSHFALWALLKAPLLIGTDLRHITAESLALLKSTEVIALNQDELGVAGDLVQAQGQHQVWAAPLLGGGRGVVLFNRQVSAAGDAEPGAGAGAGSVSGSGSVANITVLWKSLGYPEGTQVMVRDLYARKDLGVVSGSFSASVPGLDVAVLRLTPLVPADGHTSWRPWHSALHAAGAQGGAGEGRGPVQAEARAYVEAAHGAHSSGAHHQGQGQGQDQGQGHGQGQGQEIIS